MSARLEVRARLEATAPASGRISADAHRREPSFAGTLESRDASTGCWTFDNSLIGNLPELSRASLELSTSARYSRRWTRCSTRDPAARGRTRPPGGDEARPARERGSAARWRRACARGRSRISSARPICSARARRCARRSSRARPHSMVLYGPPGSGKTTLARMVAARSDAAFEELSAVAGGTRRGPRRDRAGRRTAATTTARRRSSSSTRSTASTRPSRMRCCRPSRRA